VPDSAVVEGPNLRALPTIVINHPLTIIHGQFPNTLKPFMFINIAKGHPYAARDFGETRVFLQENAREPQDSLSHSNVFSYI
jgi:hypothetical protein